MKEQTILNTGLQYFAEAETEANAEAESFEAGITETQQEKTEKKEPEHYTVKYNGKEYSLGLDELIANAQKGMNYDHVLKERNEARASLNESAQENKFIELVRAYPEVRELPDEVVIAINNGAKPLDAYRDFEIRTLREKLSAAEQNEKNKNAPSSAKGVSGSSDPDGFISALMG